jgi:hypothetical protein
MKKKTAPNDIHRRLLNVNGHQAVDVSTVRGWVARFSSGDSDVKDKPRSGRPCTAVTAKRRASRSAYPRESADYLLTYLLTPWSRVLLEKLTSKLCS